MRWLNHHHLQYFREVVRDGSLTAAAARLRLAPSTLSRQVAQLEAALGSPLLERGGRGVKLTAFGQVVFDYAERIAGLGNALLDLAETGRMDAARPLRVGVAPALSPGLVARVLAPPSRLGPLSLHRGDPAELLEKLAGHRLDVALLEEPLRAAELRPDAAHRRLLHEPALLWGPEAVVAPRRRDFPQSLDGAPLVALGRDTAVRRAFDQWTARLGVSPRVILTVSDRGQALAAARVLGALTVAPLDPAAPAGLQVLADLPMVREAVWALSLEREVQHPGLAALLGPASLPGAGGGADFDD